MFVTQLTTSVRVFITASSLLGSSHCTWPCPPIIPNLDPMAQRSWAFPLGWAQRGGRAAVCGKASAFSLSHTYRLHAAALPIQHFLLLSPACYFTDSFPSFVFVYLPHIVSLLFASLSLSIFPCLPVSLFPLSLSFFLFLFLSFFCFSLWFLFVSGVIEQRIQGCKSSQFSFPCRSRTFGFGEGDFF